MSSLIRHFQWTWVAILVFSLPAQAGEKLLAVLPLDTSHAKGKMDSDARVSVEEMLRDVAANALGASGWTVMTGETTLQLLRDNGIDPGACGESSCHLTAAREITAGKFLSGSIQWADGEFVASIRLIDTTSGRILATADLEGSTTRALRKEFEQQAPAFFAKSGLLHVDTDSDAPPATGTSRVKVTSEPTGATVLIDGDSVGKTPLKKAMEPGTYYVSLELPGYSPTTRQVTIESGKEANVFIRLLNTAGYMDLSVTPDTAQVLVDGVVAGIGKQGPYPVGKHTVHVEAAGYGTQEQTVVVDNGVTTPVSVSLEPLPGKLLVSVNIDADCEASGVSVAATLSSVTVMKVPPGSAQIVCKHDGYEPATRDFTVEPGKTVALNLMLRKSAIVAGVVKTEPRSGLQFVFMPGGTFHYGCEPQDTQCLDEEKPGSTVRVGAFWMAKTEATLAAYQRCVNAGVCTPTSSNPDVCNWGHNDRANHPINCITWLQADQFCRWMGGRLPTAQEWEFAAKSGESRIHPWGDEPVSAQRANYCDVNCSKAASQAAEWQDNSQNDGYAGTSPVGTYPDGATRWGLMDMTGDVWEWTATDVGGGKKEFRGAGWYDHSSRLRNSHKLNDAVDFNAINLGMRCALEK